MVIGKGFFAESLADAIAEMKLLCKCDVRRCVIPTTKNITYYISEHGDMFGLQFIKEYKRYIVRGPKKPASDSKHGKRHNGGMIHRVMCYGKEKNIKAEILVYCTFNLGQWVPDVDVIFRNGNANDIRPENLSEKEILIPPEWRENMMRFSSIYKTHFDTVVKVVQWNCSLSKEDAEDVSQSTFIWLCTEGYSNQFTFKLWIYWAKKRACDFYHHYLSREDGDFMTIYKLGYYDKTYEVDLFHLQKGEKRALYLQLWAQGHTPTEIEEITGCKFSSAASMITRSLQFLKNYLKNEKEYLGY